MLKLLDKSPTVHTSGPVQANPSGCALATIIETILTIARGLPAHLALAYALLL